MKEHQRSKERGEVSVGKGALASSRTKKQKGKKPGVWHAKRRRESREPRELNIFLKRENSRRSSREFESTRYYFSMSEKVVDMKW